MTYSSCLHDQQDLCLENTSRDTSEESQESQESRGENRTDQACRHVVRAGGFNGK